MLSLIPESVLPEKITTYDLAINAKQITGTLSKINEYREAL